MGDLISGESLMDYTLNQKSKTIDCNDIARFPAAEAEPGKILEVETNFFDKEEIYENCIVQVLTNTETGEVSVGWWQNEREA